MGLLIGLGLTVLMILAVIGILIIIQVKDYNDLNNTPHKQQVQVNCGRPAIVPSINLDATVADLEFDFEKANKIIHGDLTVPNSYPWLVSLRAAKFKNAHFCGGSLIYPQLVLTAAHCVYGFKADDINVAVGLYKRVDTFNRSNLYNVTDFVIHEYYTDILKANDIALIKLDRPVVMSKTVSTICLPESTDELNSVLGKNVALAGWGSIDGQNSQNNLSSVLLQTTLQVQTDSSVCTEKLGIFDPNRMYCAQDQNLIRDSNVCFGDSGGPMMYVKNKKWYVYGLTSMVIANDTTFFCDESEPSFYTATPPFVNWIAKKVDLLLASNNSTL